MGMSDIPALAALRTKMQWHQERQRLLAENIANSDTPKFKPRDLAPPNLDGSAATSGASLTLARTDPNHMALGGGQNTFDLDHKGTYEVRPAGNAVSLEDEMMKVAANQMDYQAATNLYAKSLDLLKTAIGKR